MDKIIIRRPDDFHAHLRRGAMLNTVIPYTAEHFSRALVMPNTDPPILTAHDARAYKREILNSLQGIDGFEPMMSIKLTNKTMPETIYQACDAGILVAKLYPVGVTTNSEDGISNFQEPNIKKIFEVMDRLGMILSIHGETALSHNDIFCRREVKFLETVSYLIENFPSLRIVLEHISTEDAVEYILRAPSNVAATITAHHLFLTADDVIDAQGGINPHHFCKPIAKTWSDRKALVQAAMSGNKKFFFGSDSAPHWREVKENGSNVAGIFSAPVALPFLAGLFDFYHSLDKLNDFVSVFGASFYDLPINEGEVILVKDKWQVPEEILGIVPFMAGKMLQWQVV